MPTEPKVEGIGNTSASTCGPSPEPKGYNKLESGIAGMNSEEMVAYNIAKSFYSIHPEVFNVPLISKKLKITAEEVCSRLKKMVDKHEIMLVDNPQVNVSGYGLFYWVVKLKKTATKEEREALTSWFQENDQICTGYPMEAGGDFDYFNGNHMRNLDNLISGVLSKFRYRDYVEWVHLTPVRRLIRESHVNQFDCHKDFRRYFWSDDQLKNVVKFQKEMDLTDFAIIDCINNQKNAEDMFDFNYLSQLSGLDAKQMKQGLHRAVNQMQCQVPMIYFNYAALGLKMRFFLIDFFPNTLTSAAEKIIDELADMPDWENIFDFGDSHHNLMLSAYDDISDIEKLRKAIRSHSEVMAVKEATSPYQFRRWTSRLDGDHGFWDESVFTDDLFLDRTVEDDFAHVVESRKEAKSK